MSLVKNKLVKFIRKDLTAADVTEFNEYISVPFNVDEIRVNRVYFTDDGSTHHDHLIICKTSLPLAYNDDLFAFEIDQNATSGVYIDQSFQVRNNNGQLNNQPINGTYNFKFIKSIDGTPAEIEGSFVINLEFIEYVK